MNLMYDIVGGKSGDALAACYSKMLNLMDSGVSLEAINNGFTEVIHSLFSKEIEFYCNKYYKIESFVISDIVEDLQTYHYL